MAVGFPVKQDYATGDVLTAANLNDLAGTVNTIEAPLGYAAGKNKIINGDFRIWQRGTSFTPVNGTYTADRFVINFNGSSATRTISQQTFTPGAAPVAGYEAPFFLKFDQSVAGSGGTFNDVRHRIEDVRTLANQTVTWSFWAKAAATTSVVVVVDQDFGSGGSSRVFNAIASQTISVGTSWQRFTYTGTMASVNGKTIGTSSFIDFTIRMPSNATFTVDIWGVQVEAGSTATEFQTATGTLQGELAACQRYYYRTNAGQTFSFIASGGALSATAGFGYLKMPITMRVKPSVLEFSNIALYDFSAVTAVTTLTIDATSTTTDSAALSFTVPSATTAQFRPIALVSNNNTAGYVGVSSEL
jgi:hypothetical protein